MLVQVVYGLELCRGGPGYLQYGPGGRLDLDRKLGGIARSRRDKSAAVVDVHYQLDLLGVAEQVCGALQPVYLPTNVGAGKLGIDIP